jgi:hypothetical protein
MSLNMESVSKTKGGRVENEFEVQRRAMKTFRDIKDERGQDNLESTVYDPSRQDVAVWNLKMHKLLQAKGIAWPLQKEHICISNAEANRVRGIQRKATREKGKESKGLEKLQRLNNDRKVHLEAIALLNDELGLRDKFKGLGIEFDGRPQEEIGKDLTRAQEKLAQVRSEHVESDDSGSDSSSGDENAALIIHSISSKYKTPGADRSKDPRGEDGQALSKDDKEALELGVRTRLKTEEDKVVFMLKYKVDKPLAAVFETFTQQVERRVAWMMIMHALEKCVGIYDAVSIGDCYALIQWVVLYYNIDSYSKDEHFLRTVMETRIKPQQSFTGYLALRNRDFEKLKDTKIGADFGKEYLKHMIVIGVQDDPRFQHELSELEREGAATARIVQRLAKMEKEGKLVREIQGEKMRAMAASVQKPTPAQTEEAELRAEIKSLRNSVKSLQQAHNEFKAEESKAKTPVPPAPGEPG